MLSDALKKSVYEGIPNDFTSVDAGLSSVSKLYENQWYKIDVAKQKLPVITIDYASSINQVNVPLNKVRLKTDKPVETLIYTVGTDLYTLEYDRVTEIIVVKGVVSGREHTFDSTEYQVAGGGTQIEFLGPTKPDDGTYFQVTYNMEWVVALYGGEFQDTLIVNVRARDYAGTGGTINGLKLVHTIINDIYAWLVFTADIDSIIFVNPTNVKDLSTLEATNLQYRLQFDIEVRYVYHKEVKVESIEDVQPTIVVGT